MAALAIALPAIVLGACGSPGATGSPAPMSPAVAPMSPVTSPTPVPVATPHVTPSPSLRSGSGLGCVGPIGAADEIVVVGGSAADPAAFVVEGIEPDGTRRWIADLGAVTPPDAASVSPCGHLALLTGDQLAVVDLHDPARSVRLPDAVTGEWAFSLDGRLTVISEGWGNVIVFDPRDGSVTRTPWNGDLRTYAAGAWDGSGWYAEPTPFSMRQPAQPGIVAPDGTFRRSAVLVFDGLGLLWRTGADGSRAWIRRGGEFANTNDHDVVDVYPPSDGNPVTWRSVPAGREVDTLIWDTAGRGLWLLERDPAQLHVLHATAPGEAAEIGTGIPIPRSGSIPVIGLAGEAVTLGLSVSDPEGRPDTLLRLDLADGTLRTLAEDLGSSRIAGWAAPPSLPPGVVPPTPFGSPVPMPTAAAGPVAPDLPLDALAIVTCSPTGTTVTRPDVRALDDGVHLLVRHLDGSAATVEIDADTSTGARAEGYSVVSLAPGGHEIDCGETGAPSPVGLIVLDPLGTYRSPVLSCPAGSGGTVGSADGEPVAGDEAVAWLRTHLTFAQGDVLGPAGYPAEAGPLIRVIRAGAVVATFRVLRNGEDLFIVATEGCQGMDIWHARGG
jgi:hypothetical protein